MKNAINNNNSILFIMHIINISFGKFIKLYVIREIFLFKSFVRLPFSSYSYSVCRSAPSMKLNAPEL